MTHATTDRRTTDDVTHPATPGSASHVALRVLLGCTVVVALVTFVLSFHGLSWYGANRAGAQGMSWLVPLGIDGLTLCAVAATFVLRHDPFRIRAYAWLVFAIAVAASVAGNLSQADARHLTWDGQVGAAAWPIMLALASHLVIVTRRAVERRASTSATGSSPQVATDVAPRTKTPVAPRPTATPEPPAASDNRDDAPEQQHAERQPVLRRAAPPRTGSDAATRDDARQMYRDNKSCAEIALAVGATKRTVERWTEDLRRDSNPYSGRRDNSTDDPEERAS